MSSPSAQIAPRCVLTPSVVASIATSASRPMRPRRARSGAPKGIVAAHSATRTKCGSSASAERSNSARSMSACAPEPRRSTRPGFGVSIASSLRVCAASAPSRRASSGRASNGATIAQDVARRSRASIAIFVQGSITSSGIARADRRDRPTTRRFRACCARQAASGARRRGARRGPRAARRRRACAVARPCPPNSPCRAA